MIDKLLEFCHKFNNLYCYGAGRFGREVCIYLMENGIKLDGFMVSEPDPAVESVLGLTVYRFGSIEAANDTGIILTVGRRYKTEMQGRLEAAGFEDYFYVDEILLAEIERHSDFVKKFSSNQFVNILLYHRICYVENDPWGICVSPTHFEEQIRYIKENYRVIRFEDDWLKVSDPSVVITFDDGYRDNYLNAFPILKKYDVPATFFVSTGNIGGEAEFWWDRLSRICDIDIYQYHGLLKKMSPIDREAQLEILESEKRRTSYTDDEETEMRYMMSESELKSLAFSELFEIGVHTVNHASLSNVSGDIQMTEIKDSKAKLEKLLEINLKCFSYPYGDYNEDTISILKKCGIEKAATVSGGLAGTSDLMRIPRNVVRDSDFDAFKKWFESLWCIFAEVRRVND